jgi:hypothetical protein
MGLYERKREEMIFEGDRSDAVTISNHGAFEIADI